MTTYRGWAKREGWTPVFANIQRHSFDEDHFPPVIKASAYEPGGDNPENKLIWPGS